MLRSSAKNINIDVFRSEIRIILRKLWVLESFGHLREYEMQKGFFDICEICDVFFHHNNLNTGNSYFAFRAKRQGTKKGFPDILLHIDSRLILVELKTKKGRLSREQQEIIDILNKEQETVFIIFGMEELIFFIKKHIKNSLNY